MEAIAAGPHRPEDEAVQDSVPGRPGHDGDVRVVSMIIAFIAPLERTLIIGGPDLHLDPIQPGRHAHHERPHITADVQQHGALAGVRVLRARLARCHAEAFPGTVW
jgi:hypothetical protein